MTILLRIFESGCRTRLGLGECASTTQPTKKLITLARLHQDKYTAQNGPDTGYGEAGSESAPAGSRLRLAIVEGIAKLHEGEIEVQSELGKGSAFEIKFPLSIKT